MNSLLRRMSARFIFLGLFISLMPMTAIVAHDNNSVSLTIGYNTNAHETPQSEILSLPVLVSRVYEDALHRSGLRMQESILDAHAAKELQLNWLVEKLDRTQTYLGSFGLALSMNPTNDFAEIERRQHLIKTLKNDLHLFNSITQALQQVAKNEEAVLCYWNTKDALSQHAARLYFNLMPSLNKSPLALHAVTLFDAASNLKSILGTLFLQGLFNEFYKYSKFGTSIDGTKVRDGLFKIITDHNFLTTKYMHDPLENADDAAYAARGVNVYTDGTFLDNVMYKEAVFNRQNGYVDSWTHWLFGKRIFNNSISQGWNKFGAWGEQIAIMAVWDYMLYKSVVAAKDGIKDAYRNIEGLRARMVGVANFIAAIERLEKIISSSTELQYALPEKLKNDLSFSNVSEKMSELKALLSTATFKNSSSLVYNRGRVLYANLLFNQIKHELIPAMQAMAEVDAYCSIARLVKESARSMNKFTFVTFTDTAQAYLEFDNCWISVLDPQASVANSMTLGRTNPGKVIITGPNGGGKSTWLKAVGQAVTMAHAWGIAPARKAHMSLFDAVRTSLEPRENLAGGISKFMAQKESMDKIQQFVLEERNKTALILLDEPYDGTVTDEIARRAGEFCDNVVKSKNCLAIVATHVMPKLQNEESYGWYHVDIAEPKTGIFRRTFKLRSGLAKRWFNDKAWRGRFIDWLSMEMRKKALEEARSQGEQQKVTG